MGRLLHCAAPWQEGVCSSGLLVGLSAAIVLSPDARPAFAFPTCPGSDRTRCGGRAIPEAMQSLGFLTYNEWISAMSTLQAEHPDRVKFDKIGETAGGRPLYEVIVTDFSYSSPLSARTGLYFNGDIHGDERDGTEGFARVIEDLAETNDSVLRGAGMPSHPNAHPTPRGRARESASQPANQLLLE